MILVLGASSFHVNGALISAQWWFKEKPKFSHKPGAHRDVAFMIQPNIPPLPPLKKGWKTESYQWRFDMYLVYTCYKIDKNKIPTNLGYLTAKRILTQLWKCFCYGFYSTDNFTCESWQVITAKFLYARTNQKVKYNASASWISR